MKDSSVNAPISEVVAGRAASGRRRAWRQGSVLVAAITAAVVGLVACGGGSGGSSNAGGSTHSQPSRLLAFSHCMRSQGVPNFPDPDSRGALPKRTAQQLGVTDSQYQAATNACQHLLPNGGTGPTQAEVRQAWSDTAKFTRCMRSHGVPNWPDPIGDSVHPERPAFNLERVGIDPNSPQITTRILACEPLLHGWAPYVDGEAGRTFLPGFRPGS